MWIPPEHEKLQYTGRIDWKDRNAPVFLFPCTSVRLRFTGPSVKVRVRNQRAYWDSYLGCILDGEQRKLQLPREGEGILEILTAEDREGAFSGKEVKALASTGPRQVFSETVHELLLFKRQDGCHEVRILGFELEEGGEILEPPKRPRRRMEVYGDSVSAGEVSEAIEYTGKPDPAHSGEYSNSWYSYAWMTARNLGAELHNVAQGGIGLLDGTGWFEQPRAIGMERVWDKVRYHPAFGPSRPWDFNKYIPQVVLVALGQNDQHPEDYMKADYQGEKAKRWRRAYAGFLAKLREKYPKAWILCITTLLEHDPSWDQAIEEVCAHMEDARIRHLLFRQNGRGTPGHLRIPEAEEMAGELTAYIKSLNIDW